MIDSPRFKGMHGYDPEQSPGVRAVFYAWGARIAPGVKLTGMRSVDVHPTVTLLLGIDPGSPIDGRPHPELISPDPPEQVAMHEQVEVAVNRVLIDTVRRTDGTQQPLGLMIPNATLGAA